MHNYNLTGGLGDMCEKKCSWQLRHFNPVHQIIISNTLGQRNSGHMGPASHKIIGCHPPRRSGSQGGYHLLDRLIIPTFKIEHTTTILEMMFEHQWGEPPLPRHINCKQETHTKLELRGGKSQVPTLSTKHILHMNTSPPYLKTPIRQLKVHCTHAYIRYTPTHPPHTHTVVSRSN